MNKTVIQNFIVVILFALSATPIFAVDNTSANDIFTSAIKAIEDVNSIYINAQMRTSPQDNFRYLDLNADFVPIEMWSKKCKDGQLRMRVNKPRRQIAYDATMATMLTINTYVWKGKHWGRYSRYDSGFLTRLLQVETLLENELQQARKNISQVKIRIEKTEHIEQIVIERFSKANVSQDDYMRNKFIQDADCTFVYYFDPQTKFLDGFDIIVHLEDKKVVAFETTVIEFNGDFEDDILTINIPDNAVYRTALETLPAIEKHLHMTAAEATYTFLTACTEEDWDTFLEFYPGDKVSESVKANYAGLEIISLSEPFQSEGHNGWLIPFEVKLKNGQIIKRNLALKRIPPSQRWFIHGGF